MKTIKQTTLYYRNPDTGEFVAFNVAGEKTAEEIKAALEAKGNTILNSITVKGEEILAELNSESMTALKESVAAMEPKVDGLGEKKLYAGVYAFANGDTESDYTMDNNLDFTWNTYRESTGYSAICVRLGTYSDIKRKNVGLLVLNNADYRGLRYILANSIRNEDVPGDYPAPEESIITEVEFPQEKADGKRLFNIDMSQYTDFADNDSVFLILCDLDTTYRIDSGNTIKFTLFNNTEDITGTKYLAYYAIGAYNAENAVKAEAATEAENAENATRAGARPLSELEYTATTTDNLTVSVNNDDSLKIAQAGYSIESENATAGSSSISIDITDLLGKNLDIIIKATSNTDGYLLNRAYLDLYYEDGLESVYLKGGIGSYESYEDLTFNIDKAITETPLKAELVIGTYYSSGAPVDGVATIEGFTINVQAFYTAPGAFVVADFVKDGNNSSLPAATEEDEGKFLRVVDGIPAWVTLTDVSEEGL